MRRNVIIAGILLGVTINLYAGAQEPAEWQATARVKDERTHVVPAFWADLPKLDAKTKLKILDVDGPGVVTMIHLSAIGTNFGVGFDSAATQSLILRVFYDGEAKPSIEMPLMDFLADVQAQSEYFSTVYFSKVKNSHNFRLPMPFRKHMILEVENPSDQNMVGSADVQWEEVAEIPADCGYLRTAYQTGELQVKEANNVVFELDKPATIVAHWLQFETPSYPNGSSICEANQELYLDGDEQPTLNYLGTEDVYGYSWGFMGAQSDGFGAIIKQEVVNPGGSRIALLRCRQNDTVSFKKSCRWVLTYSKDPWTWPRLGPLPYRHCVYYYSKD